MISSIVVIFVCLNFPVIVNSQAGAGIIGFGRIDLPGNSRGPKSTTFDANGTPYTGISDGRVIRFDSPPGQNFTELYVTSPLRTSSECDGTDDPERLGYICGRPTGLGFYNKENKLYIGDAYRGLLVVGVQDKLALPVIPNDTTRPISVVTALDVDQVTGDVYHTVFSLKFNFSEISTATAAKDATGRLLRYNRNTNRVTILVNNLGGPVGVALSSDRSYVLVSEKISQQLRKYWLTGPKAFTSEVLIGFVGRPEGIKRSMVGDFWVAVNNVQSDGTKRPVALQIDGNGKFVAQEDLSKFYKNQTISEFHERFRTWYGQYYVGSMEADFLAKIN